MRALLSGPGHVADDHMNDSMLVLIRYGRIVDAAKGFAGVK